MRGQYAMAMAVEKCAGFAMVGDFVNFFAADRLQAAVGTDNAALVKRMDAWFCGF